MNQMTLGALIAALDNFKPELPIAAGRLCSWRGVYAGRAIVGVLLDARGRLAFDIDERYI